MPLKRVEQKRQKPRDELPASKETVDSGALLALGRDSCHDVGASSVFLEATTYMRFGWLVAGTMALVLAGGCSTSSDQKTSTSGAAKTGTTKQAIEGGQDDTTHTFAVGVCIGPNNSSGCGFGGGICSGALITPNLVVTARHCVSDVQEPIKCSDNPTFGGGKGTVWVTTNAQMKNGTYRKATVLVPNDDHVCGEDIALLVLPSNVPASEATPITPGIQHLMWDPTYYLPIFTAIGYGVTSAGGSFNTAGTRRKRELISAFCIPGDTEHPPCPSSPDPDTGKMIDPLSLISPKEFIAGEGVCSGDSGSSAYEQKSFDKNAAVSFGVLSRGPESSCSAAVYTRLDAHRDFIIQGAKQASQNWTLYPEPAWTGPPTGAPTKTTTPDAGKSSSSSSSSGATGLGIGETCTAESECESNVCADTGDGSKVCSQACDPADATSCPDGFSCKADMCLPAGAAGTNPQATTTTTTTDGCSASPRHGGGAALAIGGSALALALAFRRRRQRRS